MPCFFRDGYQMQPRVIRPVISPRHILLLAVLTVVLYAEWWDLAQHARAWPTLPGEAEHGSLRLLLVADPQLQGELTEPAWPLGTLTRWDSDRYMRQGFGRAFQHVMPDAVVFLGDVLDEGSVASPEQYAGYIRRFWSIFGFPRNTKMVAVPGDNDIGGEGREPVKPDKVQAFKSVFGAKTSTIVDFVQFYKVWTIPPSSNHSAPPLTDGINVLVSHFPLTSSVSTLTRETLLRLRVNLIFSAHSHTSYVAIRRKRSGHSLRMESLTGGRLERLNLEDDNVVEIVVPTCSYRMGVRTMGYGAAVIDREGGLSYAVLWLPSRFKHLHIYLAVLLCVCVVLTAYLCNRRGDRRRSIHRSKMAGV
ncbi:uncharacterized protein LOC119104241 [Pollicipes pollicipes]|uniref:uncharacterized protein LOC119104241 n=1 Tax=Pollicipes pollicipes TaxID=41117 RepID=UPI001884ECDC|nr:uncharacterized protein LOC119104241 [Pollicipes pollicipes]XP_037083801.1 uncharacterized protein LOC119104241 [Pollicipes pollicipes]